MTPSQSLHFILNAKTFSLLCETNLKITMMCIQNIQLELIRADVIDRAFSTGTRGTDRGSNLNIVLFSSGTVRLAWLARVQKDNGSHHCHNYVRQERE